MRWNEGRGEEITWYLFFLNFTEIYLSLFLIFHFANTCDLRFHEQEPLAEYVRLIASVKNALQQRTDKKTEYLSALTDVEAKQIAHNKLAIVSGKEDLAGVKLVCLRHFQYSSV